MAREWSLWYNILILNVTLWKYKWNLTCMYIIIRMCFYMTCFTVQCCCILRLIYYVEELILWVLCVCLCHFWGGGWWYFIEKKIKGSIGWKTNLFIYCVFWICYVGFIYVILLSDIKLPIIFFWKPTSIVLLVGTILNFNCN